MLVTLQLALMAEGIAILLGIPLGIITAVKQDSFLDYFLRFWSITWLAIPSFWFGILVIILGLRWFAWIPPIGWNPFYEDPIASLTQLIWPALILGGHEMARVGRMTRSTVLEVLRQDYIRTARAKGLAELLVMARHAMKNAMIPVITYTSIYFGSLLGGTVVLETVFNIPGIGHWFIQAIRVRDYAVIQSLILLFTGTFVIINLLVDLMYAWLDPRIRYC
jgi:peptide/nickel transport system permease protein